VEIESRSFSELEPETAYRLWKLRADVFVVEQACAYPDLDGRDLEPGTRHVYASDGGDRPASSDGPVGYLRVLEEPDGTARIGRVCVASSHRSFGVARSLMERAIADIGARVSVLDAQSHLQAWYEHLGYVATGPEFLDDGIPHVPMRRTP
jgi:ElaA protein